MFSKFRKTAAQWLGVKTEAATPVPTVQVAEVVEQPVALVSRVQQTIEESSFRFLDSRKRELHRFEVGEPLQYLKLSLQAHTCFHLSSVLIYNSLGQQIGQRAEVSFSSAYNDDEKHVSNKFLDGSKSGRLGFHTKTEADPWVVIDLGEAHHVSHIEIMNRNDEYFTRAQSLLIQRSLDAASWYVVHDNWAVFKQERKVSLLERALEFACALESSRIQALINQSLSEDKSERAMELQSAVNQLVRPWGLAMGPHGFTQTFELASKEAKQLAYSELSKLLVWLNEEFGVPAFISSGTLLGIVRDGEFIGHDDDVDICYVGKASSEVEIKAERQALVAFLRTKGCQLSFAGVAHYWCKTPKGVHVDIFTGFEEEGFVSMNPIGRREIAAAEVLPLQCREVFGEKLYLPANPLPLLELNYGPNWEVKDPFWKFDWSKAKRDFKFLYSE